MAQKKKATAKVAEATAEEATRGRVEEMDRYSLGQKFRHMADVIEKGRGPILYTPEGRLAFIGRELGFELTLKEDGTVEAEKEDWIKGREDREGERTPFTDAIDHICDGFQVDLFDLGRGSFDEYLNDENDEMVKHHEELAERIKGALSSDIELEARQTLLHEVSNIFDESLYVGKKAWTFFGIVIGMRLCGLDRDEIKARMKWLLL